MVLWYSLHTCYRCSGRPVCWGAGYKLVACWCPQHTDTEPHTAPETDASPLGRLESPSKTHVEERWGEEEHGWLRWFINWYVSCFSVSAHLLSLKHGAVGRKRRARFVVEFTVTFKEGGTKVPDEARVHATQTSCWALSLTSSHTHWYPVYKDVRKADYEWWEGMMKKVSFAVSCILSVATQETTDHHKTESVTPFMNHWSTDDQKDWPGQSVPVLPHSDTRERASLPALIWPWWDTRHWEIKLSSKYQTKGIIN